MKQKKEVKLRLNKTTIVDFDIRLGSDEQKVIKGGTGNDPVLTTDVLVFC